MSRFHHRQLHGHPFYSHVIVDEHGNEVAWSTSLNRAELAVRLRNEDEAVTAKVAEELRATIELQRRVA